MTWDEIHTALTEIDEAFEAGQLGMSRDERTHLDRIAFYVVEDWSWEPSREDILLLEDLLARSVPDFVASHQRSTRCGKPGLRPRPRNATSS